jgi:hypothetical protein
LLPAGFFVQFGQRWQKTYFFAIFGLCVGWCELQMCMAFSVGFLAATYHKNLSVLRKT